MTGTAHGVQPFVIDIAPQVIEDLQDRLRRTRWPADFGNDDWSYGVEGGYLRDLVAYWADGYDWYAQQDVDVLCLQETKAQEAQLDDAAFRPVGYQRWFKDAQKQGYSGVAIYSRREPDEVRTSLGWAPFDDEGRYIEARFGNLSVVSFYIPSGSSGEERQGFKEAVMDWLKPIMD